MSTETKRLTLFGGITGFSLLVCSLLYFRTRSEAVLTALMLTPALSCILTRIVTREGAKALYLKPHWRGNMKWYLSAYFLTPAVALAGAGLYFLLLPQQWDPLHSSFFTESGTASPAEYGRTLLTTIPLAVLVNPLMGLVQCFGEEFAWRGYLLPHLCKRMTAPRAVLLTGCVWGLWHAPVVAMGYNYGPGHPVANIFAMVLFCIVLGTISSYLFFKTESVWPCVLFHAAVNGIDLWTPESLFMSVQANPFLGPNLTGVLGGAGFLVLACLCFAAIWKAERRAVA